MTCKFKYKHNINVILSNIYYFYIMKFTNAENYIVKIERDSKTGNVVGEGWFNEHEQPHRIGGPAVQRFDAESGKLTEQAYYKNNLPSHRDDGLHAIQYDPQTGVVIREDWKDGANGDPEAPSVIERDPKLGTITWQVWLVNGKVQRDGDRPARIARDPETGIAVTTEYWLENDPHRENGPAIIRRDAHTGAVTYEEYLWHGSLDLDAYEELGLPPPD